MTYVLLISCMVSFSLGYSVHHSVEGIDHYWRDFNGIISTDALSGGVNAKGDDLYVAQVILENGFEYHTIPAVISRGSKIAITSYAGEVENIEEETRIKVMGTTRPDHYSWNDSKGLLPPRCRYVVTGLQDGSFMYVGRGNAYNETVIGKLYADYRIKTLQAPHNGVVIQLSTYEILTYCE